MNILYGFIANTLYWIGLYFLFDMIKINESQFYGLIMMASGAIGVGVCFSVMFATEKP